MYSPSSISLLLLSCANVQISSKWTLVGRPPIDSILPVITWLPSICVCVLVSALVRLTTAVLALLEATTERELAGNRRQLGNDGDVHRLSVSFHRRAASEYRRGSDVRRWREHRLIKHDSTRTLDIHCTSDCNIGGRYTHARMYACWFSLFQGGFVTVNDLCLRDYDELRQQFRIFPRTTLTIAIFYSLPVIQLVLQYQINVDSSGNEDLCYFNFLCTRQLAMLTAFNNVFSNIGYCALGLLFFIIVYRR